MISAAIFELPTGFFSDKYGRAKTLVFGSFAFLIGSIFYAIGINYWFLVVGAIIQGLGRALYSGNNNALLYDNLASIDKINEFEEHNGKIGSMEQLATAISAIFSSLIAFVSISVLLWISVVPQIICLILSLKIVEVEIIKKESGNIFSHTKAAFKNFINNSKLRLISLSDIISFGISESSYQFRSAFVATLWPVWAIGISNILSSLGASISFRYSGKIIKKFSALKILFLNFFISKTVNLTALFFPSVLSPAIMTTTSLMYGVTSTATNKLLQDEFTSKQRATMGSLNSLFGSLFFSIFAVILGIFADHFGPRNALIFSTLLGFVVLPFYFSLKKIIDHEKR